VLLTYDLSATSEDWTSLVRFGSEDLNLQSVESGTPTGSEPGCAASGSEVFDKYSATPCQLYRFPRFITRSSARPRALVRAWVFGSPRLRTSVITALAAPQSLTIPERFRLHVRLHCTMACRAPVAFWSARMTVASRNTMLKSGF